MPRPPLEIGTWGNIPTPVEVSPGQWRASARYRDTDGVTRKVEARGPSANKARQRLLARLHDRQKPTQAEVTGATRLSVVAGLWWKEFQQLGRATNTVRQYRNALDNYLLKTKGGVGDLLLRECTTWRMGEFLQGIRRDHGAASAKIAKTVLTGVLSTAARYDAIPSNPLREVAQIVVKKKPVRALTVDEHATLLRKLRAWQEEPRRNGRQTRPQDLYAVADVMFATACRISEVLALRWQDVDLEAGTVEINGAVVSSEHGGVMRQDHAKSAGSHLVKKVNASTVALLRARWDEMTDTGMIGPMVFPSATGTLRDPSNFSRQWRNAMREIGFDWVTPHTMRKTAGTRIADALGMGAASAYLGHANEAVTKAHYVAKSGLAADMTEVLKGHWQEPAA